SLATYFWCQFIAAWPQQLPRTSGFQFRGSHDSIPNLEAVRSAPPGTYEDIWCHTG
ncbi:Hypothetical predicted protein, partial [Pelobates cultripes]